MRYIFDTNIISEAMKTSIDINVKAWLDSLDKGSFCITSITLEEITFGLLAMPSGKKQTALAHGFKLLLEVVPVLDFDQEAAVVCAGLRQKRKLMGIPISYADAQIAGIAQKHSYVLVTRNTKDYVGLNLELVNPFEN